MQDIIVPVVENDPEDYAQIKDQLISEHLWYQAIGPLEWLSEYRVRPYWVQGEQADKTNVVDMRKALNEVLALAPPMIMMDLGLSGKEEAAAQEVGDNITNVADMQKFWDSPEVERIGGLWILREMQILRQKGFAMPTVAMGTGFAKFSGPTQNWTQFILRQGATWVYPKPFNDIAAQKVVSSLVVMIAGGAQVRMDTRLGGLFHQALQAKESNLWEAGQLEIFHLFDQALVESNVTNQRERAQALGIAYNTYRTWLQKWEDQQGRS